jgi:6-phosphogluconolactonase
MSRFEIHPDAESLANAAAERFVALAAEAVAARARFTVALSGGSTPRVTYTLLGGSDFAPRVDWSRVHAFWGDDRSVPPDHPDSNYRMACESLLDRVPIPVENVHRIRGELPPDRAALAYQQELESVLGQNGRFDLILLGMGADGHTASLFPGTAALSEQTRWVVANQVENLETWRVTLTLPIINAARHVVFLVSEAAKADALARVRAGEPLPAALVRPAAGQSTWMVDQEASGMRLLGPLRA